MMSTGINPDDAEVFIYTGEGGDAVPRDVLRVRVDPSVTSIPAHAFFECKKLAEVELCDGLVEIGDGSFACCEHSIAKINIPTSLRRIKDWAFISSLLCPIRLHDDIESIGLGAFDNCIFNNFRVPPLITVIPTSILHNCRAMFSIEISKDLTAIGNGAFYNCNCLRNVAFPPFPPNAVFGDDIFIEEDYNVMIAITDLQLLFGDSNARIIWELKHRFDKLPIHRLVYYQSYNQGVLQDLIAAIDLRWGQRRTLRVKLDQTGSQQDCLGITPLHILACSSVHDLDVYRLIVEKYPTNLITKDRWGVLPLLYAFWGAAPAEIIQFLLESYKLLYPYNEFNWTMMVETMGRTDTPKESIENLLHVRQMNFPEQPIDWDYLLDKLSQPSPVSFDGAPFQERMQFLFMCGLSESVDALPFKIWRDCISNMIKTSNFQHNGDNSVILHRIQAELDHFEDELTKLKEITTILELALWKMKMNEKKSHQVIATSSQKKMKTDGSSIRQQCRVTCGADVVICHVLQFLITA
jgi:hypothetical protein